MIDPSTVDPSSIGAAGGTVIVLALMVALVQKVVDFAKYVSAKDWKSVGSQVAAWGGGIFVTFLVAGGTIGANVEVYGIKLGLANTQDKLLIGLALGSAGSVVKDWIKARDNTDSAKVPQWGGPPEPPAGG